MKERVRKSRSFLKSEAGVYQILQGIPGIPKLYWIGAEENYNVIAIELLGYSIQEVFALSHEQLPILITLALADQMVTSFVSHIRYHVLNPFILMELFTEILNLIILYLERALNCELYLLLILDWQKGIY